MSRVFTDHEEIGIAQLKDGGASARTQFFEKHREELKRLAKLRLGKYLRRRADESDIIQEAYLQYLNEVERYLNNPQLPPAIWLRRLVRQVLSRFLRDNIASQRRDVRRELDMCIFSADFGDNLADSLSSASLKANRLDLQQCIRQIVLSMPTLEREIVSLVHLEEKTLREAALELGINYEAAKKRYLRSLERMRRAHMNKLERFL